MTTDDRWPASTSSPLDDIRAAAAEMRRPRTEAELDEEWLGRRLNEAWLLVPLFRRRHPKLTQNPAPWQPAPPEGVGTPAMLEAFLKQRTGIGGWIVRIDGTGIEITPPARRRSPT